MLNVFTNTCLVYCCFFFFVFFFSFQMEHCIVFIICYRETDPNGNIKGYIPDEAPPAYIRTPERTPEPTNRTRTPERTPESRNRMNPQPSGHYTDTRYRMTFHSNCLHRRNKTTKKQKKQQQTKNTEASCYTVVLVLVIMPSGHGFQMLIFLWFQYTLLFSLFLHEDMLLELRKWALCHSNEYTKHVFM